MTCSECEKLKQRVIEARNSYHAARSNANMYRQQLKRLCKALGVKPFAAGKTPCKNCGGAFTLRDPCVCTSARRLTGDPLSQGIAADAIARFALEVREVAQQKGK